MVWLEIALVPIIGGVIAFGGWFLRSRVEESRREREKLYDERRKIYVKVLTPLVRIFAGIKNPKEARKADAEIISFDYRLAIFELNVMGSDDVIRALNEMMQYVYTSEQDNDLDKGKEMLKYWGGLILAVRRDLGNEKTKLTELDMLRGQITDIDKAIN